MQRKLLFILRHFLGVGGGGGDNEAAVSFVSFQRTLLIKLLFGVRGQLYFGFKFNSGNKL
jgi:hypothetical protein